MALLSDAITALPMLLIIILAFVSDNRTLAPSTTTRTKSIEFKTIQILLILYLADGSTAKPNLPIRPPPRDPLPSNFPKYPFVSSSVSIMNKRNHEPGGNLSPSKTDPKDPKKTKVFDFSEAEMKIGPDDDKSPISIDPVKHFHDVTSQLSEEDTITAKTPFENMFGEPGSNACVHNMLSRVTKSMAKLIQGSKTIDIYVVSRNGLTIIPVQINIHSEEATL